MKKKYQPYAKAWLWLLQQVEADLPKLPPEGTMPIGLQAGAGLAAKASVRKHLPGRGNPAVLHQHQTSLAQETPQAWPKGGSCSPQLTPNLPMTSLTTPKLAGPSKSRRLGQASLEPAESSPHAPSPQHCS